MLGDDRRGSTLPSFPVRIPRVLLAAGLLGISTLVAAAQTVLTNTRTVMEGRAYDTNHATGIALEVRSLYSDPPWGFMWLHDGTDVLFVRSTDIKTPLAAGTRARIRTTTIPNTASIHWNAAEVTPLDATGFPEPVSFEEQPPSLQLSRPVWGEAVGIIRKSSRYEGHSEGEIIINGEIGEFYIYRGLREAELTPQSTIRVRGVFQGADQYSNPGCRYKAFIPSPSEVEVVHRTLAPYFAGSGTGPGRLETMPDGSRAEIQGTVSGLPADNQVRIKTGDVEVDVVSLLPVTVRKGDKIDAVGILETGQDAQPRLKNALYRLLAEMSRPNSDTVSYEPVLRSTAEVRKLSKEEAERGLPVVIKAVITGNYTPFGLRNAFIQDETGGIYCYPGTNVWSLPHGQMVEVSGTTSSGNYAPEIVVTKIEPVGPGEFPQTSPVDIKRLKSGAWDSEWVEVAGLVTRVSLFEKIALLEITDGLEEMRVRLGVETLPNSLSNAVVRFRGTTTTIWGNRRQAIGAELWCPSPDFIHVETRLDRDPFSLEEETISALREFKAGGFLPRWSRIRGVITANTGEGRLVVQSGEDAIAVQVVETNAPAPGSFADIVGLRHLDGNEVRLYRALLRATGPAALPYAPELRSLADFPADLRGARATTEGTLIGFQPGANSVALMLMADIPFRAFFPNDPETEAFKKLRPGSRLRVSGAVFGKMEAGAPASDMRFLAASAADLKLLRAASWWTVRHTTIAITTAALVAGGAFGWVHSLRAKVRKQSREIEARFQQTRELERRNADLVAKAGEIVFSFDEKGRITAANMAAGRFVGIEPSSMIGRHLTSFLPEKDRRRASQFILQTIRGNPAPLLETRCVTAEGGWRWVEVQLQRIAEPEGGYSFGGVARDISDRKLAERARGQSAKNLRMITESLPDAVLLVDAAGIIRFKNPRVRTLLGYGLGVLLGNPISIFGSRPLSGWVADVLDENGTGTRTGTGGRRTASLKRADGTYLQADVSVGAVTQGDGRMAMVCFRDASARLAAEETLRVQALMAGTEAAVARLINTAATEEELLKGCTDIIVRRFGAAFARIWTHDPIADVLVLKASSGLYTHLDGPHSRIPVGKFKIGMIAASREPVLTDDLPNDSRASNPEWAAREGIRGFAGYPLLIGAELAGVLAVFFKSPPTDQVATLLSSLASAISGGIGGLRTLAALDRTTGKLRAILHSAPVAIVELDPDGRVSDLNPSAETLFGWRREEALGQEFVPLVKVPPKFLADPNLRNPGGLETFLERKDGSKMECNIFAGPLTAAADMSHGVVCVILDLSERRRLEAESNRIQHKLRESQRLESLGVLAGGIAHDFNNILTSILGNASLAALSLPRGTDASECISEIERGSKRAAELCRLMLAYAGKGGIEKRSEDVTEIVRDTLKLIRHGISKLARLELDLADNLPPVEADAAQIRQVVMNLIANASDALGEKAGSIRIRTTSGKNIFADPPHAELPPGTYVVLEVADTGCGMTEEVAGKIFDPFFTTKFTGRGLGLAAVWGIARGHNGAIAVHSKPGEGSVFRVWLPARPGRTPDTGVVENTDQPLEALPVSLAILIDDEAPLRNVTRNILSRYGVPCLEAENGRTGLSLALENRSKRPLVFLDLTMPEMGGLEVLRRLREAAPEIPVVLMSGYSADTPYDRQDGPKADAFLAKPFGAHRLLESATRALKTRGTAN
jgi:PAS domain S-box-containing protein